MLRPDKTSSRFLELILFIPLLKMVGNYYQAGQVYERRKQYIKASKCYHKSVTLKPYSSRSAYRLAVMYEKGIGIIQDYTEAARLYKLVAEKGDSFSLDKANAMNNLGVLYKNGLVKNVKEEEAYEWFKLATSSSPFGMNVEDHATFYLSNPCSQMNKAEYNSGYDFYCPEDVDKSIKECLVIAENGNEGMQYFLSCMYLSGKYIEKNHSLSAKWQKLAAESGNTNSQFYLRRQEQEDIDFQIINSAKKGDAKAQYELAIMCLHFRHSFSGEELSSLIERSALQGYSKAQYLLGLLFEGGKYIPKGFVIEGDHFFGPVPQAIPHNFEPSPNTLFMMENGLPPDQQQAIAWYLLAAKQGHETAKLRLKELDDGIDIEALTSIDNNSWGIRSIIKNRQIDYIVHFTRIENLDSILSKGLKTRKNIKDLGIPSMFNDKYRFDKQEDSISCSIQFPNYKMLYRLQHESPATEWVLILLSPSVLWEKDCAYSVTNAASNAVTSISIENRKGVCSLESLFVEIEGKPSRKQLGIPDHYTTDPQAEILVLDDIELDYIDTIIVQNKKSEIELNKKFNDFVFLYKEELLSPRIDYNHWS